MKQTIICMIITATHVLVLLPFREQGDQEASNKTQMKNGYMLRMSL